MKYPTLIAVGLMGLFAARCEPEPGLSWALAFDEGIDATRVANVQVRIARGTCTADTGTVYEADLTRGEQGPEPSKLASGRYAFHARAYDSSCRVLAEACEERRLPGAHAPLALTLRPASGEMECDAVCVQGRCVADPEDAAVEDAADDASTEDASLADAEAGVVSQPAIDLALGEDFTCALLADHSVTCWGFDAWGVLAPPPGVLFREISALDKHVCGVTTANDVACWGDDTNSRATPPPGMTFAHVEAGGAHTCAVTSTQSLVCWGDSSFGQTPQLAGPVLSFSLGAAHTCAQLAGALQCYGKDTSGQVSAVPTESRRPYAFSSSTCVLRADRTLECHGSLAGAPSGQFRSVSGGFAFACGIHYLQPSIECWGNDSEGKLDAPEGAFQLLELGQYHACALDYDDALHCWGSNNVGQSTVPPNVR